MYDNLIQFLDWYRINGVWDVFDEEMYNKAIRNDTYREEYIIDLKLAREEYLEWWGRNKK